MIGSCHTQKPYGITNWLVLVSLESQLQKSGKQKPWHERAVTPLVNDRYTQFTSVECFSINSSSRT